MLLLFLVACSGGTPEPPGELVRSDLQRELAPSVSEADTKQFAHDRTAFALDLYKSNALDENVVVSPYSVDAVMAMLYAGAKSTTETQMASGMHYTLPSDVLHAAFNRVDLELASRGEDAKSSNGGDFMLRSVNQLFAQKGFAIHAPYLDTLALNYGAPVSLMDFAGEAEPSRIAINEWISAMTEGLIPELLKSGSIDASIVLVLANAVYFDGAWQAEFEAEDIDFDGKQVAGFVGRSRGRYVKGDDYEAVAVPYDDNQVELVVIEPNDFGAFHAALDADRLTATLDELRGVDIDLSMPKFDIRSEHKLEAPMQKMGIVDLFAAADLSGIAGAPGELFLAWLVQEAVIKVSERGTVAAAATGGGVGIVSIPETVTVKIDRPFIYALRDRGTGALLFMGHVTKL
ncbi:MAG: serpin family protein [Deltaproteobacteria bacterium]